MWLSMVLTALCYNSDPMTATQLSLDSVLSSFSPSLLLPHPTLVPTLTSAPSPTLMRHYEVHNNTEESGGYLLAGLMNSAHDC